MIDRRFWIQHGVLPTGLLALAYVLLVATGADFWVADRWFDPVSHRFPWREAWWTQEILHRGGARAVLAAGLGALALWAAAFRWSGLRPLQRGAGYVALCFALGPGLVALGKQYSNVDCPWDLQRYGGDRPYVQLLEDRPHGLPAAHCFPSGHSSGAFAFFAFYFLLRGSRPRAARAALAGAIALGVIYGATQWVRGAHFPTHDLGSAWICWMACLFLQPACLPRTRTAAAPEGSRAQPLLPAGLEPS